MLRPLTFKFLEFQIPSDVRAKGFHGQWLQDAARYAAVPDRFCLVMCQ